MKFATLKNGKRDGRLVVVARDLRTAVDAPASIRTLQEAVERWDEVRPGLQALYDSLNAGHVARATPFDPRDALAPMPRAHQFVDASAFLNHGSIMERAANVTIEKTAGIPILVPRQADDFRGPCDDFEFPTEADNCDFEGEVGAITGEIPMGTNAIDAERRIRLFVLFNDVSMRAHMMRELKMGFGFVQAKPATVFGPVAVTPDELGDAWQDGRIHLDLHVHRNGQHVGHPNGGSMDFSFGELLAHLAYNRRLRAGMLLGSGTFSDPDYREVGSACLAEQRAAETIDHGAPKTDWLRFGERLRFEMFDTSGLSVFGAIDHALVRAEPPSRSKPSRTR